MDLYELGEAFREARIAADKTQEDVAKEIGTTKSRISQFESGRLPQLGIVRVLALLDAVGFQLIVRPLGPTRTLEDALAELSMPEVSRADGRQRVRRPKRRKDVKTSTES